MSFPLRISAVPPSSTNADRRRAREAFGFRRRPLTRREAPPNNSAAGERCGFVLPRFHEETRVGTAGSDGRSGSDPRLGNGAGRFSGILRFGARFPAHSGSGSGRIFGLSQREDSFVVGSQERRDAVTENPPAVLPAWRAPAVSDRRLLSAPAPGWRTSFRCPSRLGRYIATKGFRPDPPRGLHSSPDFRGPNTGNG